MDISDDAPKLVCGPNGLGLASGLNVSGVRSGDHPICFPVDPDVHFGRRTGLHVVNSLTGKKMEFIPRQGNTVNWYACGPTVYDASHMGHARTYLSMDILRRILEDYFSYEVFLQLNVTDVDDKIIMKARRNKLVADYTAAATDFNTVKADVAEAATAFGAKLKKKLAELEVPCETKREEEERVNDLLPQQKFKVERFADTMSKIDAAVAAGGTDPKPLIAAASECLADALDAKKGHEVTQHEVFDAHSRKYEADWIEDLIALNIRLPDALTRVTEYVPKIVDFVKTIIDKGLAYESNGSVYMDIASFRKAGHEYPKLEPSKGKATAAEMAESEGALFKAEAAEKRNATDFALWKKSKAGEPSWDSPWGGGRPGWHIECSVMASDLMGSNMDVHAGGVDLKFPHHDNEICQSEAFHGCAQWVNHFWHFGHLHIKGLKMSKSLKNFITIKQALENFTARQLRLLFLLQPWDKSIDFSDQTANEAKSKEGTFITYFGEVKAVLRDGWLKRPTSWGPKEHEYHATILARQGAVHKCMCDNFNTPGVMTELLGIASDTFTYLTKNQAPDALLLKRGAIYVTRILRIFGVITLEEFGFPVASGGGDNYEASVGPIVTALVGFRDEVRTAAKASKQNDMLAMCDKLRDEGMVDLGVRIEDRAEGAVWKLDDPAELRKEVQAKKAAQTEQAATKLLNRIGVKAADLAKAEAASVPPEKLLQQPQFAGKYGPNFDEAGKPTSDAKGEALSKAMIKEMDKLLQKQQKEYQKHTESLTKNPGYIDDMKSELEARKAEAKALLEAEVDNLSEELVGKLKVAL